MISVAIVSFLVSSAPLALGSVSGAVKLANGRPGGSAVVFLEGSQKSQPLPKAVVDQRGRKFIPHISVVTVGTEIQFPNNDTVFHNVFAEFHAKKFDLGMYARGKTKKVQFDRTGLVAVLCSIHSEMSAYVMIVDTPFYTISDSKGNYVIESVPAGEYTLRVWHESGQILSHPIKTAGAFSIDVQTARK